MPARRIVLAIGDASVLTLFAVIGLVTHHRGVGAHGLARDAVPVLAGWFVASSLFGTYRRGTWASFFAAWALGVSGGVLFRGLALHRRVVSGNQLTFLAVTLAVTLLLLLAWRGLVALADRWGRARAVEQRERRT